MDSSSLQDTSSIDVSIVNQATNSVDHSSVKKPVPMSKSKVKYEFCGPFGALSIVLLLPLVVFGLYFVCNKSGCIYTLYSPNWTCVEQSQSINIVSRDSILMYAGWMMSQVLMQLVLPGIRYHLTVQVMYMS